MPSARGKKKTSTVPMPAGAPTDFQAAAAVVRASPEDLEAWERLESLGASNGLEIQVAAIYRELCEEQPALTKVIGERAVEYHDASGEDPAAVAELVERMFTASPDAAWALDRLKLTYSSEGRWPELLGAFDIALTGAKDDEGRALLLEDAARVAKDFARDLDRAISYSEQLFALTDHPRTRASLEKLYEKCERHESLIAFYRKQLEGAEGSAAQTLRTKMATLWLTLDDVDAAFAVIEAMLAERADEPAAFDLLERIFAVPPRGEASPTSVSPTQSAGPPSSVSGDGTRSTRQRAALLLKPHYVAGGRAKDLVRVLQVELAVATNDTERAATYRELVALQLDTLQDDAGAMFALAALVVLEPGDDWHRKLLADVSARLGRTDRRAKVLMTAADRATDPVVRASLLVEAAEVCAGPLASPPRAIDLYQRVLGIEGISSATLLSAARELETLLEGTGRLAERCAVLERLATLESDPALRRAALGEVARIASTDFGDTERAIGAWRARLGDDPADTEAIAGMRVALGSQSRWRELLGVLEKAAAKAPAMRGALLLEAATLSVNELSDVGGGIQFLEELYAHAPADLSVMDRLATLYGQQARHAELLTLRRKQVELEKDSLERVRLRLEIASVLELTGDETARVLVLEANLADDPREAETVRNLAAALESLSRFSDLHALFERQAEESADAGDFDGARALWTRAGDIAEHRLTDFDRAIAAHEKAGENVVSLDALARLYAMRDEPLDAATALERLLGLTPVEAHIPILLRLSSAYLAGGRRDAARRCLEEAAQGEGEARVRSALADIYRADESWGPLAEQLTTEARSTTDPQRRVDLLREAAELYLRQLANPTLAIPLLEEALAMATQTVSLSLVLAPALVQAGRADEAITLLGKRISEFGARRPKERAQVHHALSRAMRALGLGKEALLELEAAVKIDPLNLAMRRALADSTAASGGLEAAQRIYRALLLVVPRQEGATAEVARSEVLICLAVLAEQLGDASEAADSFDSALAAARESEAERAAAERELGAREKWDRLAELLKERLEQPDAEQAASACDRLATLYEEHLDKRDEALAMRLRAISLTPTSQPRHAAALATARSMDALASYVALVSAECARAKSPEVSYELHSLLGAALEEDGKIEEAAGQLELAERAALELEPHAIGGRRLDRAWKSLDRIYRRLGDDAARAPVLERRAGAAEARRDPALERAEILYDLAAIRLAKADTQAAGLEILARAIAAHPDDARSEMALLAALEVDRLNERALGMYENLSRAKGQERALIDALQRISALPHRSGSLLEAARLAETIGDRAEAEVLLRRFVDSNDKRAGEAASEPLDRDAGEALLSLSLLRGEAGDVREAALLKERAAAHLGGERARPILLEVAALAAGPLADLTRAARIYTALLADSPTDPLVWAPLAEVYRSLGDVTAFSDLVDSVTLLLESGKERARLRLDQATLLLRSGATAQPARPAPDLEDDDGWGPVRPSQWPKSLRPPEGGSIHPPDSSRTGRASLPPLGTERAERALWKVLDDEPGSEEAVALLSSLFERADRSDDLAKLIDRQLVLARERGDDPSASSLSTRLGSLHEERGRDEAAATAFREAVRLDPKNLAAHRSLMRLSEKNQDPREVANATEVLLQLEVGSEAERLALRLASLLEGLGDAEGVQRALAAGLERCPESQALRDRIESSYEKAGLWRELADYHLSASETRGSIAERVDRLRLAATVLRRELSDPRGAAEILERALALAPTDRNVLLLLINSWSSAGEHARAVQAVDAALADGPEDQEALFHMRSVLHDAAGARQEALADLETAVSLSGGAYSEELATALEQFVGSDKGSERQDLRMRLVEVLHGLERFDDACAHLEEILRRDPEHRDARAILAALDAKAGRIDQAIASYKVLLTLEEGSTLVNVTLALADVCEEHGRLEDLIPALTRAHREAPAHAGITRRLTAAYTALGQNRPLADLILEEAARQEDVSEKFALLAAAARLLMDPEKGDPDRSTIVLAEARDLKPDDPEVGILLADALIASGKTGEALDMLEQLAAGQKRRSKARSLMHSRIADLYSRMGAQTSALQSLVRAMDDDPHDAALAMRTGLAAVELNDADATNRAFRTVTLMKTVPMGVSEGGASSTAKCVAYYHLARVAQRQGDHRKARLMIEKSIAEAPTPEARALRDSLKV